MKKHIAIALSLAAAVIIGCMPNLASIPKEKCAALPNDNVVKAIQDNCVSCHRKDFTTKQDICARKAMIIDAVKTYRMPKMGKLYPEYFKTLTEWK